MALPTGRHAVLLSIRAKLLKAHILAADAGMTKVSNEAFKLYTEVDSAIGKPNGKSAKRKVEEDIEGDDAAE